MPWQERSLMTERTEFVVFARQEGANIAALCRRYGISRKTGYKWLARAAAGDDGVADRSRRPHTSPRQTTPELEAQVVALRTAHPAWGGRKLHHRLVARGVVGAPAPSTVTGILRRHGLLAAAPPPRDHVRFEHAAPNDLYQIDFMGHRPLGTGRVHPLTVLDDHSRFALVVAACATEQQVVVQAHLSACFRRYGLPQAILTDNGAPWGTAGSGGLTALEAWLLRLGIAVWHGRVHHPQTQGKVERLHGTIAAEVFAQRQFTDLAAAQAAFDRFRASYNHARPHEALAYAVPASRYRHSPRPFPEVVPPIVYGPEDAVRRVSDPGRISFQGREVFVSHGLVGQPVAVRPTRDDGVFAVWYCQRQVATVDLRQPT